MKCSVLEWKFHLGQKLAWNWDHASNPIFSNDFTLFERETLCSLRDRFQCIKREKLDLSIYFCKTKGITPKKHFFIRKLCLWQIASLSNWTCSFPSFYSEVLVDQSFMCMDALDCFQTHILMILCRKFCILSQVYSQIWAWPSNTLSFFLLASPNWVGLISFLAKKKASLWTPPWLLSGYHRLIHTW